MKLNFKAHNVESHKNRHNQHHHDSLVTQNTTIRSTIPNSTKKANRLANIIPRQYLFARLTSVFFYSVEFFLNIILENSIFFSQINYLLH
jgi:fatty acid desaturase